MNRRSDQELSLSEILRTSRGPQESSALEQLLRQSSNELLNATLPPDVRRRYTAIGSEQTKTIERLAREIRQKRRGALQNSQEDHGLTGVIPVDFCAHFSHTLGDLFARNEDFQLSHGDSY